MAKTPFFSSSLLLLATLICSCEPSNQWFRDINASVFSHFGSVIGKKPPELSLKQVHLSRDDYYRREIFVAGKVIELAEESTFAIIDDGEGRLLIKLTHLPLEVFERIQLSHTIKVFGKLEYGKLGLPLLTAHGVFNVKAAKI